MPLSTEQLDHYLDRYPNESETVQLFHQLLKNPNQFQGQLIGSSWLINHDGTQILLTHHKKLNQWVQLGGHMEPQDQNQLSQTALRESLEESGLQPITCPTSDILHLTIHSVPHRENERNHSTWLRSDGLKSNAHYNFDVCFIHQTELKQPSKISQESHDLKWFSLSELLTQSNAEKEVKILAAKWQIMRTELLLA